jgi:hypothetical protein
MKTPFQQFTGAALVAAFVGLGICGHARGEGIELPASGESLATYLPYADAAEPVLSDFIRYFPKILKSFVIPDNDRE